MGIPTVVFDPGYSSYDAEEVCSFLDWKDADSRVIKLFKAPRVAWKVTVSGYAPDRITVSRNKDVAEKDLERPDDDAIRSMHKQFLQPQKCLYLYLDANGYPMFFGDKSAMVATDKDFYQTLPELTVDALSDFIKDLDKNIKTTYFIGPSSSICFVRRNSVPRLFYPFLIDFIEERYPTLREAGEAQQFITEASLRIFLTFFISWKTGIFLPTASCILPESYLFAVSLDGYLESPFGIDGLPNDLTKDLTKMMPRLSPAAKSDTIVSSPVSSDPRLVEIVKSRMKNPITSFYTPDVLTDTNIKDSIDTFVRMSWVSFLASILDFRDSGMGEALISLILALIASSLAIMITAAFSK